MGWGMGWELGQVTSGLVFQLPYPSVSTSPWRATEPAQAPKGLRGPHLATLPSQCCLWEWWLLGGSHNILRQVPCNVEVASVPHPTKVIYCIHTLLTHY